MRIIVMSDVHLDWVTMGVQRFDEVANAVAQTVTATYSAEDGADAEKADLFLFLGDLCDPDSGSTVFRCIEYAMRTAATLSRLGVESHWLAGNHDVIEDGKGHTTLYPLQSLGEGSGLVDNVFVHEEPWKMLVPTSEPKVNLICLPYTATSHPYDPADFLTRSLDKDRLNLVIGHLTVPGVEPGEETTEMPRGRDVVFPIEAVREAIKTGHRMACLNGHYHRQQAFDADGFEVLIPGSLARLTAGESDHKPSYLELEVS